VSAAGEGAATPRRLDRRTLIGLALVIAVPHFGHRAWVAHVERSTAREVAAAAAPGDILMISSTTCGICAVARAWFTEHGVPHRECFVEHDPACAARLARSLQPGTPVFEVRGRVIVGFDPQRLRAALRS
jgi:glutaredoxin